MEQAMMEDLTQCQLLRVWLRQVLIVGRLLVLILVFRKNKLSQIKTNNKVNMMLSMDRALTAIITLIPSRKPILLIRHK